MTTSWTPNYTSPRRYGDGGLTRRKALIIVTAGEDERTIGPRGLSGDIDSLLFPLTHGALWYVGIDALDLHVVHDADSLAAGDVERERERLLDRLQGIDTEPTRSYRRLRDGDYPSDLRALHPDVLPGRADLGIHRVVHGPAAPQGRFVPPSNPVGTSRITAPGSEASINAHTITTPTSPTPARAAASAGVTSPIATIDSAVTATSSR